MYFSNREFIIKTLIVVLIIMCTYLLTRSQSGTRSGSKGEAVIFSAVKGQICFKGQPLEGIKLTRAYPAPGGNGERAESIYSDEKGEFSFEEIRRSLGIMKYLPHEAVISQSIKAEYSGNEYVLWNSCKRNYKPLGELISYQLDPILSPEMKAAYDEGYILLNCDLENSEETAQMVNDHVILFSIADFRFPYEMTVKEHLEDLRLRDDEFTAEIVKWFEEHTRFIDQKISEGDWSEMEREGIDPYRGAIIESVASVEYSDHIRPIYFEEDYYEEFKRVPISGSIIVNVINPEGESMRARVWMSEAMFRVGAESVILDAQDHYFGINSFNIDPNVVD